MVLQDSKVVAFRRTQSGSRSKMKQQYQKLRGVTLKAVGCAETHSVDFEEVSEKRRINFNSTNDFSWRRTWSAEKISADPKIRYYKGRMYVLPLKTPIKSQEENETKESHGIVHMSLLALASFGLSALCAYGFFFFI